MNKKKILIIDDEKSTLQLLKIIFEKQGYEILTLQDDDKFLQDIELISPDLILLDIIMPKVNGLVLLEQIKRNDRLANIPVIILTSRSDVDLKINALKMGAIDYVTKPFQKDELPYRVKNIFENLTTKKESKTNCDVTLIEKLFTNKNDILTPAINKNSQFGYIYPQAMSIMKPYHDEKIIQLLNEFSENGYLEKYLVDIIHLCPRCHYYTINFHQVCPYCFHAIDEDNSAENYECSNCQRVFTRPEEKYTCFSCGFTFKKTDLIKKKLFKYTLPKKIKESSVKDKKLQENLLVQAFHSTFIPFIEFQSFKDELANEIFIANEKQYNVTVLSIEIKKFQEIQSKFGDQLSLKLLKSILLVGKKFLRHATANSYRDDNKIFILLPKIHLTMAKIIAEKIQNYFKRINQEIELEIKLASYPEDGYNETEIMTMLELGIETMKEKFVP
jgi:FixJ family two-component response regulator